MAETKNTPERSQTPAPTYRDPFTALRSEMDRLFDDFSTGSFMTSFPRMFSRTEISPQTDIKETESEVVVTAELPGVTEDDVTVTLQDNLLTLRGEKKSEEKRDEEGFHMVERRFGSFQRAFRLPDSINDEKVKASFDNGVLTVAIEKKPEAQRKARKIAISKG